METWNTLASTDPLLDIEPETFTFAYEDLSEPIVITSNTVSPGEMYSVGVSGTAADDCNSAGGSQEGTATVQMNINLDVWTTAMACMK